MKDIWNETLTARRGRDNMIEEDMEETAQDTHVFELELQWFSESQQKSYQQAVMCTRCTGFNGFIGNETTSGRLVTGMQPETGEE